MAAKIIQLFGEASIKDYLAGPTREWMGLTLHHSAVPTAAQYKGIETIRAIQRVHIETNGWRDIGYHILFGPEGAVFAGRRLDDVGAHAVIHKASLIKELGGDGYLNNWTLGVCCIGNYDTEQCSDEMRASLNLFDKVAHERFKIQRHFEHRQATAKTCPGKNLWDYPWPCMVEIRSLLNRVGDRPSDWAKATWEKMTAQGVVDGSRPGGWATREMVGLIAARADEQLKEEIYSFLMDLYGRQLDREVELRGRVTDWKFQLQLEIEKIKLHMRR